MKLSYLWLLVFLLLNVDSFGFLLFELDSFLDEHALFFNKLEFSAIISPNRFLCVCVCV
jgi:hypothetical protein